MADAIPLKITAFSIFRSSWSVSTSLRMASPGSFSFSVVFLMAMSQPSAVQLDREREIVRAKRRHRLGTVHAAVVGAILATVRPKEPIPDTPTRAARSRCIVGVVVRDIVARTSDGGKRNSREKVRVRV